MTEKTHDRAYRPTFTVFLDVDNEDLSQHVTDERTWVLIELYRLMESKTLFQHVADELDYRYMNRVKIENGDQIAEIEALLG